MDCMKEFAPGPHYDPSAQVNVLCTGKQVDDAKIARKASQWKTHMIVEVPPEAAVHQTKQAVQDAH